MLALVVALISLGLPQDAGSNPAGAELAAAEITQVLAEAEKVLEQATAAQEAGDPATARTEADRVIELLAPLPLGAGHDETAAILWRVGQVAYGTGNLAGAREAWSRVVDHRERTLPADHPDLLTARGNLAITMRRMRDQPGSRALEEAVLEGFEQTLPPDHPDLLTARGNLAATMWHMGDLPGARALQEVVLEASERMLPADHPSLLIAQYNLATTMKAMGDLAGARALFDTALAGFERTLPADHPDLLRARGNLAFMMRQMGDLPGARALEEAVLEARERTLPADHPDLLRARGNLAITMRRMGDQPGARALQEAVLEAFERTLPADHPDLLTARGNLAITMRGMGDQPGARALQEAVLEARERTLPADHHDLLTARGNLAGTMWQMGDQPGARALQEAVLESFERTLPADHPHLLTARGNLANTMWLMGDQPGARAIGLDLARGMLRRLELAYVLSPREAREAVGSEIHRFSLARILINSNGSEVAQSINFDLAETIRAVASVPGASTSQDDPRRREISTLRASLNDLVSGGPGDGQSSKAFAAEISRLALERDRLERSIRGDLAEKGVVAGAIRTVDVANALPEGAAAVGFLHYNKWVLDPVSSKAQPVGEMLAAHVLLADGSLAEVELGAADELEELARKWRSSLGKPTEGVARGSFGERIQRGEAVEERDEGEQAGADQQGEAGDALRARILDPILDLIGEDTTTLFVCLDDFLHLVPLDALPLGDGRVGDRYEIVNEVSFARLLTQRTPPTGEPSLLAMGGVQFDAEISPEKHSPTTLTEAGAEHAGRGARPGTFEPLLQTRLEVESVLALFEDERGDDAVLLTKAKATKAAFREHAPGKRFLHVATHGWFAPETVRSTLDARDEDALWSRMGVQETVTGLAPMTLCGLAFAGANQGRDSLGRVPGILTAEELAGIDLSNCELAVLSACETNVGIRRAGQGIQSLQAALHAAGARTAITSLWKVDDFWTRELMTEFYRLIWVEERAKAEALWEAKMKIRERGAGLVDWAGWVLTGDPV